MTDPLGEITFWHTEGPSLAIEYTVPGPHRVRVMTLDESGRCSAWSEPCTVMGEENPPPRLTAGEDQGAQP
ncbi:hypothetical protein [Streptomyces sp. CS014]|uniref:hypothetical protein n=1 Tax=Streptomyces sp. CS014 TaxID=2162707 RepID=UPI0013A57B24|nr:hypothetical protein [Streptomyces sp. CS014]